MSTHTVAVKVVCKKISVELASISPAQHTEARHCVSFPRPLTPAPICPAENALAVICTVLKLASIAVAVWSDLDTLSAVLILNKIALCFDQCQFEGQTLRGCI